MSFEDTSLDHFVPKSLAPAEAYEWKNFRLCRRRLNTRKDNHTDVLDPFALPGQWFKLDFRTFLMVPDSALQAADRGKVVATIDRLHLNIDNDYVSERVNAIREYCLGRASLQQLSGRYPFIAQEMINQDFDANFLPRMKAYFSSNR